MSAEATKGCAGSRRAFSYAVWRQEMDIIADLASRAGVIAPSNGSGPSTHPKASPSPPVTAAAAPSWGVLLAALHTYPYGDHLSSNTESTASSAKRQTNSNNTNNNNNNSSSLSGIEAMAAALARVDDVLLTLAQETRLTDLAASHTAEAQTLMYRALLYRHAHLLFQQLMDSVVAYEKAVEVQPSHATSAASSSSPSSSPLPPSSSPTVVVESYSGLVTQVAQLYEMTDRSMAREQVRHSSIAVNTTPAQREKSRATAGLGKSGEAETSSRWSAVPAPAARVIDPSSHRLPSSSATAAAAQAEHALLSAGSRAMQIGLVPSIPHSRTHSTWFTLMQQRQAHFLLCEARDYQRAGRLWIRVELERRQLGVPTHDDALALAVLCVTMACGVRLRDVTPDTQLNPYTLWQYEAAAERVLDSDDDDARVRAARVVESLEAGGVPCARCGGRLPIAEPQHLASVSALLLDLAHTLEHALGCTEQAVNFYELAAVVLLEQKPAWWRLGTSLAVEDAVRDALEAYDKTNASKTKETSSSTTSMESGSWWGGLVTQITSTFARDGMTSGAAAAVPESPRTAQARRARDQQQGAVRSRLAERFAQLWKASVRGEEASTTGVGGGGSGMYRVYSGHWASFETALEGAARCAAQCQEYALSLVYTSILLDATACQVMQMQQRAAEAEVEASAAPGARMCWCASAVWRRRRRLLLADTRPPKHAALSSPPPPALDESVRLTGTRVNDIDIAATFDGMRIRCLVRRVLLHLLLHEERSCMEKESPARAQPAGAPSSSSPSSSPLYTSRGVAWVRCAKAQIKRVTGDVVSPVGEALGELVEMVAVRTFSGPTSPPHVVMGSASARQAWLHTYSYHPSDPSPRHTSTPTGTTPSPSMMTAPPLAALPVIGAARGGGIAARLASGALDTRHNRAYAALKRQACAADAIGTMRRDGGGGEEVQEERVGNDLWSVVAGLMTLTQVVAQSLTTPLQCMPEPLVCLAGVAEGEDDKLPHTRHDSDCTLSAPRDRPVPVNPIRVRRRVDADLATLEHALWNMGLSDFVLAVLQQRLRRKLFFPPSVMPTPSLPQ